MHYVGALKVGLSVLAAASGQTPTELAISLVRKLAHPSPEARPERVEHCDVCHEANARALGLA